MPMHISNQSLQRLQNAVARIAKIHNVTKDIVFDLIFIRISNILEPKISEWPQLNLESIETRPDICFFHDSATPGKVKFIFFESTRDNPLLNTKYIAMLTLYERLLYDANYNLNDITDYDAFVNTIQNVPITPYGYEIELPVNQLVDLINSEAAQNIIQLIKNNHTAARAYDASIPDLAIDATLLASFIDSEDCIGAPLPQFFPFDSLTIPSIGPRLSIMFIMREIDLIISKYQINTSSTDILEYSLALMFGSRELPENPTFYAAETSYADMKRTFLVELDIPQDSLKNVVANINACRENSATLIEQGIPKVKISYTFMQNIFLPRLTEFLEQSPELVRILQDQYRVRSRQGHVAFGENIPARTEKQSFTIA